MSQSAEKPAPQIEKKPEQKTPPSSVDTFETVMNQIGKFFTNPFVLVIGIITTIFLMRKQQSNDLVTENVQLKERLRMFESELTEVKRKFKKLKATRGESNTADDPESSQDYSIEHKAKAPYKLPIKMRRTLFLD